MASPSPVPLPSSLVVKNGSNTRARSSGGMPAPVSATSITTAGRPPGSSPGRTRGVSRPPSGMASAALVNRFRNTCRSCCRSAWMCGHARGELRLDPDLPLPQVVVDQFDGLGDLLAHVHGGHLVPPGPAELEQVARPAGHPLDLLLDRPPAAGGGGRPRGVFASTPSIRRLTVPSGLFSSWAMLAASSPTPASLAACQSCVVGRAPRFWSADRPRPAPARRSRRRASFAAANSVVRVVNSAVRATPSASHSWSVRM